MLGVVDLTAAILVLTAAIFFYWTGRRECRLLAKIPRPPSWPVIGVLPEVWKTPLEDLNERLRIWSKELGPIFLLDFPGVHDIFLSGPEEIQTLLNSHEHLAKGATYSFLRPWIRTGLLTGAGNKWHSRRKMLAPAFHYNILEGFVPVFNANSAILVAKLREHTTEEYVEIDDYVTLCALDIICETMMGTSIKAQLGGEVEYIRAVKRMGALFVHRNLSPWIHSDLIYELTPSRREEKKVVQVLKDFTENVIKMKRLEHQKIQEKNEDGLRSLSLLDLLLEMSDQNGKLTDDDIREEVDTFMFAGHDTTAAAISWSLFLLGAHQDVQDKVVAELTDIFGSDRREPTLTDLQNMKYLDMVIKESLRLYPSVTAYARFIENDLKIGEYTIPPRRNVFVSAYIVHRNPDIYPEPERFDPERFSPEQSSGRHPYAYIPFSAGPRNCIGQKFARLEEKSVLSAILRNFKLESLDHENVKAVPEIVLKPKNPLKLKISGRVL